MDLCKENSEASVKRPIFVLIVVTDYMIPCTFPSFTVHPHCHFVQDFVELSIPVGNLQDDEDIYSPPPLVAYLPFQPGKNMGQVNLIYVLT